MRRSALAVLVLLVACSKQPRQSGAVAATKGPVTTPASPFLLREAVTSLLAGEREMAGVSLVWIAEVEGPAGRAAVVWPALANGHSIDNDVIAFSFARDGAGWKPLGREIGPMRGAASEVELHERLGGELRLVWPDGPPPERVAPDALAAGLRFHRALADGKPAQATAAAEDYLRSFGPRMAVFDNGAVDLLLDSKLVYATRAELRDFSPSGDRATARGVIIVDDRETGGPVELVRRGTGWAIDALR